MTWYVPSASMGANRPHREILELTDEEADALPDGVAKFRSRWKAKQHMRKPVTTPPGWTHD